MRVAFFALAAVFGLLLSAPSAAVAEQATAEALAASVPLGATPKEIEERYGTPTERTLSEDGGEIWTYDIKTLAVKNDGGLLDDLGFSSGNVAGAESERIFRIWFDHQAQVTAARALSSLE
ncbi:MAG: hypothetical protein AAFY02_00110 [Pseudomonadota bacterium]